MGASASLLLMCLMAAGTCWAQDGPKETPSLEAAVTAAPPPAEPAAAPPTDPVAALQQNLAKLTIAGDTVWVLITGFLVFFMNLGFACVEAGMCRSKNCVNILSKNFVVFAVTSIGFWLLGWGIMFGNSTNEYFGTDGLWMVSGADNSPATLDSYQGDYGAINWTGVPLSAKFFFQLVFAGTAATIVSGAVAERIKYHSFIIFSFIMAMAIYPVVGHWIWGGGWLQDMGFVDFAGCTQVHSIGGWAALVGVYVLGPRIGKYGPEGKINAIPAHNFMAATIGCLILWFGWFGFNPGSTMAIGDFQAIADIALTTNLAAAAATLTATVTCWLVLGKPDLGMTLNGCLAGLVGITASCAFVTPIVALLIGAIAGVLVVFSVMFFDRIRADDPVGATSVHLVCGVFGTLCVGLFSHPDLIYRSANTAHKPGLFYNGGLDQTMQQLTGIGACAIYVVVLSAIAWLALKATLGIRVSAAEEIEGLDHGEHGNVAYHGFQISET
jgi:Amt family ammonium transporter